MYERNRKHFQSLKNILNFITDYFKKLISNSIEDPILKMKEALVASENHQVFRNSFKIFIKNSKNIFNLLPALRDQN